MFASVVGNYRPRTRREEGSRWRQERWKPISSLFKEWKPAEQVLKFLRYTRVGKLRRDEVPGDEHGTETVRAAAVTDDFFHCKFSVGVDWSRGAAVDALQAAERDLAGMIGGGFVLGSECIGGIIDCG
jgi:hypothetical protein